MQSTVTRQWLSTGWMKASTGIWKPKQQEEQELPRCNLYRHISRLPMEKFIDCVCDNDLTGLIIDGAPTDEQLREAWVMILSQYYEMKGGVEDEQWRLSVDVQRLQNHLAIVDRCVTFLKLKYSESIATSLNKLGYPFKPKDTDPTKYGGALNSVVQKSKTKYIQLKQMIKQLDSMIKEIKNEKPKREDFEKVLNELEEMQGATYDFSLLTVQRYLLLEKKYLRKIEMMQNKKH